MLKRVKARQGVDMEVIVSEVEWQQEGRYLLPYSLFEDIILLNKVYNSIYLGDISNALRVGKGTKLKVKLDHLGNLIYTILENEIYSRPIAFCLACNAPTKKEGDYIVCTNKKCPETLTYLFSQWFAVLDIGRIGFVKAGELASIYGSISNMYKAMKHKDKFLRDSLLANDIYNKLKNIKEISLEYLYYVLNIRNVKGIRKIEGGNINDVLKKEDIEDVDVLNLVNSFRFYEEEIKELQKYIKIV